MNKANRIGEWMQTFTGIQFFPLDPRSEDINITDIAHALSMKCRYNGHCKDFYSVAEHSVLCADVALELHANADVMSWALLHDAAEAYLPDVPRPLKLMGVGILSACEDAIMAMVIKKFKLDRRIPYNMIKQIDNMVLAAESTQVMGLHPADWCLDEEPANVKIKFLSPKCAESLFISAYRGIFG